MEGRCSVVQMASRGQAAARDPSPSPPPLSSVQSRAQNAGVRPSHQRPFSRDPRHRSQRASRAPPPGRPRTLRVTSTTSTRPEVQQQRRHNNNDGAQGATAARAKGRLGPDHQPCDRATGQQDNRARHPRLTLADHQDAMSPSTLLLPPASSGCICRL